MNARKGVPEDSLGDRIAEAMELGMFLGVWRIARH